MSAPSSNSPPIVVLITGCSSGIGYELMQLFDREPYRVEATALPQSMEELSADPVTASERIRLHELDVTDYPRSSEVVASIVERFAGVDILINNAGASFRAVVEHMSPEDEQLQMQTNYLGAMHLIRCCLPQMRERRSGRIINVSSVGGMMAMPTMASYSASKFALEGATEALWYELRPWKIKVSLVRPGFINSLAFKKVRFAERYNPEDTADPYCEHYSNMTRFVARFMARAPADSADVARKIFRVATRSHPPLRNSGTPDAWFFHYLRRLLPRRAYHHLLYRTLPGVRKWGKSN